MVAIIGFEPITNLILSQARIPIPPYRYFIGGPYGNRTHLSALKGLCPNR